MAEALARDPDRFALFLDVDGTLLDIAPRPDEVAVEPWLPSALARAATRLGGALALVSGRRLADLDRLFAPHRFAAAGIHGTELRLAPGEAPAAAAGLPPDLHRALRAVALRFPGVLVEDKGAAIAFHTRQAPELADALHSAIAGAVAAFGDERIDLLPGKAVLEVKPRGIDKGRALAALLSHTPFAGRRPIYIGDDVTDEPALETAARLGGLALAVGAWRPGAETVLDGPDAVRHLVRTFAGEAAP